jgi:hypothetical protein
MVVTGTGQQDMDPFGDLLFRRVPSPARFTLYLATVS